MRVRIRLPGIALAAAALAAGTAAEAQESGALTLGAGRVTVSEDADAGFTAPAYVFTVQGAVTRHLVIAGELAHWSHDSIVERGPHPVSGPTGVIGSVTGTRIERGSSLVNLGANLLLRSTGRVRLFGGGGASMSWDAATFAQQSFGCSPGLDPRTCDRFASNRWRGPLPLFRALGGIEGSLTPRVGLFASVRYEIVTWEDRQSWTGAIGGLRIAFD